MAAFENFRLQPEDWSDSDENEPLVKKKVALAEEKGKRVKQKRKKGSEGRLTYLYPEEESALSDKCVPKNTATSTKWAIGNFERWREGRNRRRDRYMMIFHLVGTVLPCASSCLCRLPRHQSKMDLYSRQRVCTCFSQPYCVTCAPRILLVRIFLILPSVNLWGYIMQWIISSGRFLRRVFLLRVDLPKPLERMK